MSKNDYSYWSNLNTNTVQEWFGRIHGGNNPERPQALQIVKKLSPESLLEIGPGNGRDYEIIRQTMPNVKYCGVEVSRAIIDGLREKFPNVDLIQGNLYDGLSFSDKSFDVVYARYVLEHMPYYEKPIIDMLRVARYGVVVTMFRGFKKNDELSYHNGRNDNYYGFEKFERFLSNLSCDYELIEQEHKPNKKIMVLRFKGEEG